MRYTIGWMFAVFSFAVSALPVDKEFTVLEKLSNANGVSGFEEKVSTVVKKAWAPFVHDMHQDGMGNVIAHAKTNKAKGPKLLLMAHMDEVGFMVSRIDKRGFIHVQPLGGILDNVVMAERYTIHTDNGDIDAYSGVEAIHLVAKNKRERVISKDKLFLDIGAKNKKDAVENFHIRPGLAVTPQSTFTRLSKTRYLGKALDDRLGLAVISDVIKRINKQPNQLWLSATTQEEVGLRGAQTVYHSVKPDAVINVEIGIASDFPLKLAKKGSGVKLGKGPTLFVYDASMIPNQKMVEWVRRVAKKENISLQYELEAGYGEDAARIQLSGQGVASINIGIPMRYAHQHAGVFDSRDYKQAVKLVTALVKDYKGMEKSV